MARWSWSLACVGVLACASTEDLERTQGGPGDPCYPNGTCNASLVCVANVCVLEEPIASDHRPILAVLERGE